MAILRFNRLFSAKFCLLAIMSLSLFLTSSAPNIIAQDKPGSMTIKIDTQRSGFNRDAESSMQAIAGLTTPITIKANDIGADAIAQMLSSQSGCNVTIKPAKPDEIIISIDIATVPMTDILKFLCGNYPDASVQVNGYDFRDLEAERKALYSTKDVVFSLNVTDVPLKQVVQLLRLLSLREIKLNPIDEEKHVTLAADGVTVPEFIKLIAGQTDSKIQFEKDTHLKDGNTQK